MRSVSDRFHAALTGSHRAVFRARVLQTYQDGPDPDGTFVRVINGEVEGKADAAVRHTLGIVLDGRGWDFSTSGLVTPYGNDIFVERGITWDGLNAEWCPLGYYRIWDAVQEDAPDGPVSASGRDRMSGIKEGRLEAPVQYLASNTVSFVFEDLIQAIYPAATINFDDSTGTETLGRSVIVERKRYEFLRDLAAAYGKVFYVDELGQFRIASPPAVGSPVKRIKDGEDGTLVNLGRELSREGVHNAVVATGEGTDDKPPVRGVARDNNPQSPTYYYGTYGQVPRFYSSQYLKSGAQCRSAARNILVRYLGLPHAVELTAAPDPTLEPYDPIEAEVEEIGRRIHIIDENTIPLNATDPIEMSTRQQVDLQIEEG